MTKSRMFLVLATASVAALAASAAQAQTLRVENAVARVVYVPEDRADIAVEITNTNGNAPRLSVSRSGNDVLVRGDMQRRNVSVMRCRSDSRNGPPSSPGEGAVVTLRETGTVYLRDAPMIFVRGPREVSIRTDGVVYGSIGRGGESVSLNNTGCGDWVVANVRGQSRIAIAGSGNIWNGTAERLDVSIGGSGDVYATRVEGLNVTIGGSGDVEVQGLRGSMNVRIAGSGDVKVQEGRVPRLAATIAGSGDVYVDGAVGDVSATIMGSGNLTVRRVTGDISRTIMGSGKVRILD